jgi:tetratricopeptide (TPR) repeat protein
LSAKDVAAIQRQAIPGYARAGKPERAVDVTKNMLDAARTKFGADHPEALSASARLAHLYELTERMDDAEALWRETVTSWKKRELQGAAERDESSWAFYALGKHLIKRGQPAEAEPLLRAYLDRFAENAVGTPQWMEAINQYGVSLLEQKKYAETEKVLLGCFQRIGVPSEKVFDASMRAPVIEAVNLLVRLYDETKQPEKATEWRQKISSEKKAKTGPQTNK